MFFAMYVKMCVLGPYSQNILRLKVAPNLPIKKKIFKIMGVSVLNLGLLNFSSKSISQSILVLKLAPKSVKPTHNYPRMAVAGNLPQNINIFRNI